MLVEFCLPVYNEEQILKDNTVFLFEYLKREKWNFNWRIVILVNGSSDGSAMIARELERKYNGEIKYSEIRSGGRGGALKTYWQKSEADIICYMDIDLAASLEDIKKLISPIERGNADLVIGSRLLPGSKIERSFVRELSSRGYNFVSRFILGHGISDMQCGFKALKAEALKKVLPLVKNNAWFFDTELVFWCNKFGYRVKEIPVDWAEERYDKRKSKVKLCRDTFRFLLNLTKLKLRYLRR